MRPISFKRHRFPPEVIRPAVWLYLWFTLSLRDVRVVALVVLRIREPERARPETESAGRIAVARFGSGIPQGLLSRSPTQFVRARP